MINEEPRTQNQEQEADERLFDVAQRIRLWQEGQSPRVSDNALLERYRALGSSKTYAKLRARDASQLDAEEWLQKYLGVWSQVEADSDAQAEVIYPDLSWMQDIYRSVLQLSLRKGLDRLVIIEGDSGYGKTEALRYVTRQLPGNAVYVDADESWARPTVMVGQIILATGAKRTEADLPATLAGRLSVLVDHLKRRQVILIDEGHHLSGESLNILKTLLNRTPSTFVVAALGTLWKKLQANAWHEAKQLIVNRMFARVRLAGPSSEDASKFFTRRFKVEGAIGKPLASIVGIAPTHGGMAFIRNIAVRCKELGLQDLDATSLLQAAAHVREQVEGR